MADCDASRPLARSSVARTSVSPGSPLPPSRSEACYFVWYCMGTSDTPCLRRRYSTKALYCDELQVSRTVYKCALCPPASLLPSRRDWDIHPGRSCARAPAPTLPYLDSFWVRLPEESTDGPLGCRTCPCQESLNVLWARSFCFQFVANGRQARRLPMSDAEIAAGRVTPTVLSRLELLRRDVQGTPRTAGRRVCTSSGGSAWCSNATPSIWGSLVSPRAQGSGGRPRW